MSKKKEMLKTDFRLGESQACNCILYNTKCEFTIGQEMVVSYIDLSTKRHVIYNRLSYSFLCVYFGVCLVTLVCLICYIINQRTAMHT